MATLAVPIHHAEEAFNPECGEGGHGCRRLCALFLPRHDPVGSRSLCAL
jgi:hypothetical protein